MSVIRISDHKATKCVLNVVLCGATGFGFIKAPPGEHPYAFTACLIGFCHGLVGLIEAFVDRNEHLRKFHRFTSNIMHILPLPLLNVDLYLAAESNNIALAHGLFLAPLAVSVLMGHFKSDFESSDYGTHHTLRILTLLGNVTSLVFLAINDNSIKLGAMALLAFMAKFGSEYCVEKISYDSGMPVTYLSWAGMYILGVLAVSGEK
ncbi:hypothetical protein KR032_007657 [Drosophila birchii]|nr:hypothetical protein KR032_007657 [Drosophila birchii]